MVCCKVDGLGLTRVVALDTLVCTTDVPGSMGPEVDGLVGFVDFVVRNCVIDIDA